MKKTLSTITALALVVCLFACKNSADGPKPFLKGQGVVAKENIIIGGKTFAKTSEIVVIPTGEIATIIGSDKNWSTYYLGSDESRRGVFINDRTVTLSPYVISAYEVTQELYYAVMGNNPSNYKANAADGETQELRPVEYVSWYDCVAFCNELTKKTMSESDCVYTISNISEDAGHITNATVTFDISKNGYRLPTEAEWEFAARGGDPTNPKWKYAYAGVQTNKPPANFTNDPYDDDVLDEYAWYSFNSDTKTHEVGKKTANTLGLYDMSGNAWEWCYDWYDGIETGNVPDPIGAASGSYRVLRGGSLHNNACVASVSSRNRDDPYYCGYYLGFRLVRSIR